MTRTGFVAKNKHFSPKSGDENGPRRQKQAFLNQKRRRERASSPKTSISHLKVATRTGLVAKNKHFSTKSGDEIGFRRQNYAFFYPKRRRERISSPKTSISQPKTATRKGLVVKIEASQTKNGDEIGFRRQNYAFFYPKRRRERISSSK
ncbi:hypothetical protein NST89_04335 [Caldifermentibacillus hisashii]|uniref:hypothetical protein n=1 Tax=Caldifermentibacillus hisashii TaxID=996558 RepID=UPI003134BB25